MRFGIRRGTRDNEMRHNATRTWHLQWHKSAPGKRPDRSSRRDIVISCISVTLATYLSMDCTRSLVDFTLDHRNRPITTYTHENIWSTPTREISTLSLLIPILEFLFLHLLNRRRMFLWIIKEIDSAILTLNCKPIKVSIDAFFEFL